MKELTPGECLPLLHGFIHVYDKIFFSKTAGPIKTKFDVEPPWEGGKKGYINGPVHVTDIAAMPIYGKNFKNLLLQN